MPHRWTTAAAVGVPNASLPIEQVAGVTAEKIAAKWRSTGTDSEFGDRDGVLNYESNDRYCAGSTGKP